MFTKFKYFQSVETRSETDALKAEIGDLKEELLLAVNDSALEINSRTDALKEEIRVVREENLSIREEVDKLSSQTAEIMHDYSKTSTKKEEERPEPFVILVGEESTGMKTYEL